jgi:hypothetical protein
MTMVVMAPVVPIVVVVSMVMMVAPVVPMMAVVPVMAMMTPVAPRPVSRHGGGRQIGVLGHDGRIGGRLGGRRRRSHTSRDGGDYQQPLEHEVFLPGSCGTHRKAKERAMNPN